MILVEFDRYLDVVSARVADARIVRARPAPSDDHLLFELDERGEVVGLELLGPSELSQVYWRSHPDRARIPQPLVAQLDAWLAQLWADLGRPPR